MKNKLKNVAKLPIVIGVVLFIGLGSLIVYAATNASDVRSNDLEIGILKGDIEETFTETSEVNKDTDVEKVVSVVNNGNLPLFVRVMIFPEITVTEAASGTTPETTKILPANIGEQIKLTLKTGWLDGGDGYYYYTDKLAVGATTSDVIDKVSIDSTKAGSEYTDAELTIHVKSETVSTSGDVYRQSWWGDSSTAPTTDALKAVDDLLQPLKD